MEISRGEEVLTAILVGSALGAGVVAAILAFIRHRIAVKGPPQNVPPGEPPTPSNPRPRDNKP